MHTNGGWGILVEGDLHPESNLGGKVCESRLQLLVIPFPWLTGVKYTLGWKACHEGEGVIPPNTWITQGIEGGALDATAAELFWLSTDPKPFFPCSSQPWEGGCHLT